MRRVAIIGAGRGGSGLLHILSEYSDVELVGIADPDKNAIGLTYAQYKKIPIYRNYFDLIKEKKPAVVLNLTHDPGISKKIRKQDSSVEVLGALGAKLLWDLVFERKKREDEKVKLLTELAETNQELYGTTAYLEKILENSGDMIITTDLDGKIVTFNKGAEDMLLYSKKEVKGLSIEKFYLDENERQKVLKALNSRGSISNYETKLKKKDGTILDINITLSLLKDDEGKTIGTVGISKDITGKKKLEKEILRSNKELENFVYTVSHDLQAPLRAIDGFSSLLMEEYKDVLGEEGIRYSKRIMKGAGRMKILIEDLLELSKISRVVHPYETTSTQSILEEVQEILQYTIENAGTHIIIKNTLPDILCDRARIRQVFINLITNSIKYVKKDIVPEIKIGYKDMLEWYEFYIADNGIGIKQEYFLKIFNLFQRLHQVDEFKGTGIGLTIVKRIIEMHGGTIWLESTKNKGTTFYFTIPKEKELVQ